MINTTEKYQSMSQSELSSTTTALWIALHKAIRSDAALSGKPIDAALVQDFDEAFTQLVESVERVPVGSR